MSQFRDAYGEFRREDVEVVAMSVDSAYAHREWAKMLAIEFPMASDFEREVLQKYDAVAAPMPFLSGIARYCAFLIDQDGILQGVWYPPAEGGLSPVVEVLQAARNLNELSEH